MNTSSEIDKITGALLKLQSSMPKVKMTKTNPHFRSKYAGLDDVMDAVIPALNKLEIVVIQPTLGASLVTRLIHSSGQWVEGEFPIVSDKENAQGYGSALTYARRYALCSMLGVVADEDDDGNAAQKPVQTAKQPQYEGAGEFMRSLELTKTEMESFKNFCASDLDKPWGEVALRAKAQGIKNYEELDKWLRN